MSTRDLTTGPVPRRLLALALPVIAATAVIVGMFVIVAELPSTVALSGLTDAVGQQHRVP